MLPLCRAHPIKFRAFLELKFRHVIMIPQTPNFRWTEPCKLSMIKSIKILHGVQSLWEKLKRAYHGGLPPASPTRIKLNSFFHYDIVVCKVHVRIFPSKIQEKVLKLEPDIGRWPRTCITIGRFLTDAGRFKHGDIYLEMIRLCWSTWYRGISVGLFKQVF